MVLTDWLLGGVAGAYAALIVGLFTMRNHRKSLLNFFSFFFGAGLLILGLFTVWAMYVGNRSIELTNYSSQKGTLYFLRQSSCSAHIRYDFAINANEVKVLQVREGERAFEKALLLTEEGKLLDVPLKSGHFDKLAIWEKELSTADDCFMGKIQTYRWQQTKYGLAVGLLLYGVLFLTILRFRIKREPRSIYSAQSLSN